MARDNGVPADRFGVAAEDSRGGAVAYREARYGGPDLPCAGGEAAPCRCGGTT